MTHLISSNNIEEWTEKFTTPDGEPGIRFHRDDGPAQILPDGTHRWFHHGLLHRTDGPAVVYGALDAADSDASCRWYVNGHMVHTNILNHFFKDNLTPSDDELVIFKLTFDPSKETYT